MTRQFWTDLQLSGGETLVDDGNSGTSKTIDVKAGQVHKLAMTGNCTLTLTSPPSTAVYYLTLKLTQDATGTRTMTWPASVKWGAAGVPTLSTATTKVDWIILWTDNGGTTWYGSYSLGY